MFTRSASFLFIASLLSFLSPSSAGETCACGDAVACFALINLGRADLKIDGPYGATCLDPLQAGPYDEERVVDRCCNPDITPNPNDFVQDGNDKKDDKNDNKMLPHIGRPRDLALVEQECKESGDCQENVCHICWQTREFPEAPHHTVAALRIPTFNNQGYNTCGQLYYLGLQGGVENVMCRVLQDYLVDSGACACPVPPKVNESPKCLAKKSKCKTKASFIEKNGECCDGLVCRRKDLGRPKRCYKPE